MLAISFSVGLSAALRAGSLNKAELIELLDELSERLKRQNARASIYIVGGAAMALAFDRSRTTHDIDARIDKGHGALIEAVHEIAHRRGLPTSWLNEQAASWMPVARDKRARTVYASEYLTVTGASGEHIPGMKLEAGRAFDQKEAPIKMRQFIFTHTSGPVPRHAVLGVGGCPITRGRGSARGLVQCRRGRTAEQREPVVDPLSGQALVSAGPLAPSPAPRAQIEPGAEQVEKALSGALVDVEIGA